MLPFLGLYFTKRAILGSIQAMIGLEVEISIIDVDQHSCTNKFLNCVRYLLVVVVFLCCKAKGYVVAEVGAKGIGNIKTELLKSVQPNVLSAMK